MLIVGRSHAWCSFDVLGTAILTRIHTLALRIQAAVRPTAASALIVSATLLGGINQSVSAETTPAKPCQLDGVRIDCGSGRETVTLAMANPDSRRAISDRGLVERLVANGDDREAFRRSLEGNRRQMVRFAQAKLRDLKRRRISADTFEEHKALYNTAMETYKIGLLTYRQSIWLRKNR